MSYRPFLPIVFLLLGTFFLPATAHSQSTAEQVKSAIHTSLGENVKEVYPTNNCDANDSGHNYSGEMTITRTQEVSGTLRIWGKAKVSYRNLRTGGNTAIEYYAECKKQDGGIVVSKLKWRRGPCMRFASLVGG